MAMNKYQAIEYFVGAHDADEVKKHYDIASDKPVWEMAIQTHIACGERIDLETVFPKWPDANPANHDWN